MPILDNHFLCRPFTKLPLASIASLSPPTSPSSTLCLFSLSLPHPDNVPSSPGNSSLIPSSAELQPFPSLWPSLTSLLALCEDDAAMPRVDILKQKMQLLGIGLDHSCLPAHFHNLFCPKVSFLMFLSSSTVSTHCLLSSLKCALLLSVCLLCPFLDAVPVQRRTFGGEKFVLPHHSRWVSFFYFISPVLIITSFCILSEWPLGVLVNLPCGGVFDLHAGGLVRSNNLPLSFLTLKC